MGAGISTYLFLILQNEEHLQHGYGEPIAESQAAGEESQQRDEEQAGMPAPVILAASAREAAARLLNDRVQSGIEHSG